MELSGKFTIEIHRQQHGSHPEDGASECYVDHVSVVYLLVVAQTCKQGVQICCRKQDVRGSYEDVYDRGVECWKKIEFKKNRVQ